MANDLLQNLEGIYAIDPTEQELAAGIKEQTQDLSTPTYAIPEFDRYSYAARNYGALPSMYQLYLGGGFDAAQDDFPIQAGDITGGQIIDTGAGGGGEGDVVNQLGTVDEYTGVNTLADIDTGVGEFDDLGPSPDYSNVTTAVAPPSILNPADTTPDYSNVGTSNPRLTARATPISEMGTRPPDFVAGAQTFTDPDPSARIDARGTTITGTRPPDFVAGIPTLTEPVPGSIGNIKLQARGDVTTTPDYTYDPMDPPMLGDEGASMDYMLGSLDAPYGVHPVTGIPYETPRTIADQKAAAAALGNVTEQDTSESLYEKAKNYLGEKVANSIDWTSVIAKGLLNSYIGKPVSLLFDAVGATLPPGGPTFQTQKAIELGLAREGETQDKYGINTESLMGDYDQYNVDRVSELENNIERSQANYIDKYGSLDAINEYGKNWEGMNKRNLQELKDRREYVDRSGAGGDIQPDATDLDIATGVLTGDGAVAEDAQDLNLQEALDRSQGVETGDAAEAERIAAENRAAAEEAQRIENERAANAREEARAEAAREAAQRAEDEARAAARERARQPAPTPPQSGPHGNGDGPQNGGSTGGGGGYTGGGWCFDPNTFVQMADGSEKKIKEIKLGDNTKGGEVTGVFQFKAADEIHDYKGVTVAGSHYVKEDGKFIMVQDSPISVKIDKIPVVYSLDTTGRRIFIKGIEFADYNGDGIAKGFLHNAGLELNGFNKEVLRQVENRLI